MGDDRPQLRAGGGDAAVTAAPWRLFAVDADVRRVTRLVVERSRDPGLEVLAEHGGALGQGFVFRRPPVAIGVL